MTYQFKLLNDRPVLLNTLGPRLSGDEISQMAADTAPWLDRMNGRVYYLVDARQVHMDLDDVIRAAVAATHGDNPVLLHAQLIDTLLVTTDPLLVRAARSMNSPLFRNLHVRVFPVLDDALTYVDSQAS